MTSTTTQQAVPLQPYRPGLAELVEDVRRCTKLATDPGEIAELVAEALVRAQPSTALLTETERAGSPEHYVRHTLHAEDAFSLVALVWRPGQRTEIHDHLVWCSFLVLQGAETETLYSIRDSELTEVGVCARPTGSASGVAPPDDIHQVTNTGEQLAITLHAYGANLSLGSSVNRTYPAPAER